METIKQANKFSFGIGIFLFLTFGFTILSSGFQIKSTFGFIIGIYNIWQHGFVKDTSKWKFNPKLILLISVIILLLVYGFLLVKKINTPHSEPISRKYIVEQIEQQVKKELPRSIGDNGDSIMEILAINENTIEYLYKMNSKISEWDPPTIKLFESDTRAILIANMKKVNPNILIEYRKDKMKFRHKYLDLDKKNISTIEINASDY